MARVAIATLDLETTGLDQNAGAILEIGIVLYDVHLNEIASAGTIIATPTTVAWLDWLRDTAAQAVGDNWDKEPFRGAKNVHEMHQKNGLAEEIRTMVGAGMTIDLGTAEQYCIDFLEQYEVTPKKLWLPMTGSSILFDRQWIKLHMPQLDQQFHYRNTDISSIKNLAKLYRHDLDVTKDLSPVLAHRSISDCRDSAGELKYYIEKIFLNGPPPGAIS